MRDLRNFRFRPLTTLERLKFDADEGAAMLTRYTGKPPRKIQRMLLSPTDAEFLDDTDDGILEAAWLKLEQAGARIRKGA